MASSRSSAITTNIIPGSRHAGSIHVVCINSIHGEIPFHHVPGVLHYSTTINKHTHMEWACVSSGYIVA